MEDDNALDIFKWITTTEADGEFSDCLKLEINGEIHDVKVFLLFLNRCLSLFRNFSVVFRYFEGGIFS